ncbi:MAG: hypothetical protein ACW7DM_16980 [Paraglaciecola chathamensis]
MKIFLQLFALIIVFCVALSSCSIVNSLRMMNANNEIKPIWKTAQHNKQILTAYYIGEKPYIKLRVNKQHEAIFDGVIGHDLMKHFVWTFDKRKQTISLAANSSPAQEKDVALPFTTSLSKISIQSTVYFNEHDSNTRNIVIDTGSRHYMKMNTAYADKNDIRLPSSSISAADFGLSGKALHQRVTLPALQLGNLSLPYIKTNIIKSNDEDDWWILGSALLNQFIA